MVATNEEPQDTPPTKYHLEKKIADLEQENSMLKREVTYYRERFIDWVINVRTDTKER